MLGQRLDIDLLPGLAAGIGEPIAKIGRRVRGPGLGGREDLGIAQPGKFIDQQRAIDVQRRVQGHNHLRGCGAHSNRARGEGAARRGVARAFAAAAAAGGDLARRRNARLMYHNAWRVLAHETASSVASVRAAEIFGRPRRSGRECVGRWQQAREMRGHGGYEERQ